MMVSTARVGSFLASMVVCIQPHTNCPTEIILNTLMIASSGTGQVSRHSLSIHNSLDFNYI